MLLKCVLTVAGLSTNRSAMVGPENPSAASCNSSRSRGVSGRSAGWAALVVQNRELVLGPVGGSECEQVQSGQRVGHSPVDDLQRAAVPPGYLTGPGDRPGVQQPRPDRLHYRKLGPVA